MRALRKRVGSIGRGTLTLFGWKSAVHMRSPKPVSTPHLVALVNLAIEQEREACAKIVEEHAKVYAKLEKNPATSAAWAACIDIHDSISERGDA